MSALVLLATGAEEMETVITVDVLRRGGVQVTVAGLESADPVKCSRDVMIVPDKSLDDAAGDSYDVIILPGGAGGAKALAASDKVKSLLEAQDAAGKLIAAICAAPTALQAHGIGKGKSVTSYPAFKEALSADYNYTESMVEVDGNLITSRGPGTAVDFALKIVNKLKGEETAIKIGEAMLV
eukprot:TRINITY_DN3033_c0_g1_i5.p1 TRINITY_DN3033_c0_g1~~TRINITY_DN3033_c0_g1_i5.p1  ORF type:complete len:182 (+),score=61.63 TRINITY_DN3033_c0_g1_i5:57-602(+)